MDRVISVVVVVLIGALIGGLLRRQSPRRLLRTMSIAVVGCVLLIGLYALGGLVRPPTSPDQFVPVESLYPN
jgi:hypothetical protein